MTSKLDEYTLLKNQLEKIKNARLKHEGSLLELEKSLQQNFDIENIEDARVLFDRMKSELSKMDKAYEKLYQEFISKYGDRLDT